MKLHADKQFQPTQEALSGILNLYGHELVAYELAKNGVENVTIMAETNMGALVVRVYRQDKKSDAEIEDEIRYIDYLREHGIQAASVLLNIEGRALTHIQSADKSWQVVLMEKSAGTRPTEITDDLVFEMATIQAKMHLLSIDYRETDSALSLLRRLDDTSSAETALEQNNLNPETLSFIKRASEYTFSVPYELPSGVCHLDYSRGNLLMDDGHITAVLDFDDMAISAYAVCLAYSLYHTWAINPGMLDSYLSAYDRLRPLIHDEKAVLPKIMLYRHYFISSQRVMFGAATEKDIATFFEQENQLKNLSFS